MSGMKVSRGDGLGGDLLFIRLSLCLAVRNNTKRVILEVITFVHE